MLENFKFFTLFKYVRTLVRVDKLSLLKCPIDFFHIPVNNGIKSRLGWTNYSDLYEIVHPSLDFIFSMFAHWSGMRERSFGVLVCGFADVFLIIYLFIYVLNFVRIVLIRAITQNQMPWVLWWTFCWPTARKMTHITLRPLTILCHSIPNSG